jgi:hypothetical protein
VPQFNLNSGELNEKNALRFIAGRKGAGMGGEKKFNFFDSDLIGFSRKVWGKAEGGRWKQGTSRRLLRTIFMFPFIWAQGSRFYLRGKTYGNVFVVSCLKLGISIQNIGLLIFFCVVGMNDSERIIRNLERALHGDASRPEHHPQE